MADIEDLKARVDAILSGPRRGRSLAAIRPAPVPNAAPQRRFSEFIIQDVIRAKEISDHLRDIVDAKGNEEGLTDAVDEIERLLPTERPGLVQHAAKLFITHHPLARQTFALKPLERRMPNTVLPSTMASQAPIAGETQIESAAAEATAPEDDEQKLAYWREDPLVNEHHEHWHIVYPTAHPLGDRHGELFAYMHEQMLARYDAERLAAGLNRVQPFADYRATSVGYDPGNLQLWDGQEWSEFRPRPAGTTWHDLDFGSRPPLGVKVSEMEDIRDLMFKATAAGQYQHANGTPILNAGGVAQNVAIDNLGDAEESNTGSVDAHNKFSTLGNHHGMGHVHFAYFDGNAKAVPGVMITTATAVRDPVFLEWHKHVDSIFQSLQQKLPPYDFSDAPAVQIRKTPGVPAASVDIILCATSGLPANFNGPQLGQEAFGYSADPTLNRWDGDFSNTVVTLDNGEQIATTDTLFTASGQRPITLEDAKGNPVTTNIDCQSHDDFCYFLRVQNLQNQAQAVTVRIFLAPETQLEDKTSWIEMDRFRYTLDASARAVIFRSADASSVIRMPALKWNDLLPTDQPSKEAELPPYDWCDCGWPYTLLLPRGTAEGMPFRLFVMLSSGNDLNIPPAPGPCDGQNLDNCTSISYCGLKGASYPDSRPMGYPFDRPFATSISDTVAARQNMAWRTIKIQYKGDILTPPGSATVVVSTPAPGA
jgi:hypothetical protein